MPRRRTDFNPRSLDATLATLVSKMDAHHEYAKGAFEAAANEREAIRIEVKKTNGRVTALEFWKTVVKTQAATVSALVSGIVVLIGLMIAWFKR